MIFGKYINRYYLKNAPVLLLGLLALLMVDYIQLLIPQFYRLVINGVNPGQVVVNGDRKSTRLNSSHKHRSRMPSSA